MQDQKLDKNHVIALIRKVTSANQQELCGAEALAALEGWDSFATLEFMLSARDDLGASVNPEQLQSCKTVDDLVAAVTLEGR